MPDAPFAYDVISYPWQLRPQMHPAKLGAIARLHGVPAAWPAHCRLLEIGCGDAASLLPLAQAYPQGQFVGIDLARDSIARGEAARQQLGLTNLTLAVADLTDWPSPGSFDYVVAHGFYSWVPSAVRDALLAVCRDSLTPAGIAYISYNTLPGCHIRRMLWDMLRFHVRHASTAQEQIDQSHVLLQFLATGATGKQAELLKAEANDLLQATHPAVLFHDDLSDVNDPVTITEFTRHAAAFCLRFLAEADYFSIHTDLFPEPIAGVLNGMAEQSVVLKEQYLDFLKLRRFRQTLLCRAEAAPRLRPDPAALAGLSLVCKSEATPSPVELSPEVTVQFANAKEARISLNHPVAKAAFVLMNEAFPYPLTVEELVATAFERAGVAVETEAEAYLRFVLTEAFRIGLVEVLAGPPRFARRPDTRPRASPLARLQLTLGLDTVTNLRPSALQLASPITRELVSLLDGSRDEGALLEALAERVAANPLCQRPNEPPRSLDSWREQLAPQLQSGLELVARNALLMEE